jgi:REP element-mobilizing transposase RayT
VSTYTRILYHIVFATKDRLPVLADSGRGDLFRYMNGVIKNSHCRPIWTNGVRDHVHSLLSLHPTVALSGLLKDMKVASSIWAKENPLFPNFMGWQEGYGAFTHSLREQAELIAYVKGQEEHHRKITFEEEYRKLLADAGIEFDERYFP